jgi:Fic family protein
MKAKYTMTREQSVFVAKRNIVDYIYKSAKLEGLGVTYPDTEAIYNGMVAPGVRVSDIVAVNNLKHAWQFLLDTLDAPTDYAYVCQLNRLVGGDNLIINAGYIRKLPVTIGGTSWRPTMPEEDTVKQSLLALQAIAEPTERAIMLMLTCMRGQYFLDGNKRTAMLAANKEMIAAGAGIITVAVDQVPDFTRHLVDYYETEDAAPAAQWVYDNCIDGIAFEEDYIGANK